MERILLSFSENEFKAAMSKLRGIANNTQQIVDGINAINNYRVDAAGLRDILFHKGEHVASQIEKAVKVDLERAGIGSATVRTAAIKGDVEKFYAVLNSSRRPSEFLEHLSIDEDGNVFLSAKVEENLKEAHSQYITTERGLQVYEAHKRMVDAMNEFLTMCPEIPRIDSKRCTRPDFGQQSVTAAQLNYDRLAAS